MPTKLFFIFFAFTIFHSFLSHTSSKTDYIILFPAFCLFFIFAIFIGFANKELTAFITNIHGVPTLTAICLINVIIFVNEYFGESQITMISFLSGVVFAILQLIVYYRIFNNKY